MSSTVAPRAPLLRPKRLAYAAIAVACLLAAAAVGWNVWRASGTTAGGTAHEPGDSHGHDEHAGHQHDHAGHSEQNSLELSRQARESIGLREGPVALSTFRRTIGVPGIVIERPGRSKLDVIAPMTGFVTKILHREGEAVAPDQPLFEVRLTHEELVQAQASLLKTTEELDVVHREIKRLESAGEGVVALKTLLDRKYEQQKLVAASRAQQQALLLHGLSEAQVNAILESRTLLSTLSVKTPREEDAAAQPDEELILQVLKLNVDRGQNVDAGESMAVLADHRLLLIEGEAFEQDAPLISQAVAQDFALTAVLEARSADSGQVEGLHIAYVAGSINPADRTLHFYVDLPNHKIRDARGPQGERFVEWQFKPGQRMQLRVPVEEWPDRIVLPSEAVAQDGVENYVFRANGDHFDRQPVKIEHRDPQWVVVANDGSLFPGERVALSAAQQLQLALKNKSGGAVDPHAGHNH